MRPRTLASLAVASLTLSLAAAGCSTDAPKDVAASTAPTSATPSPTAPAFTDLDVGTMDVFAEDAMVALKTVHVKGSLDAWGRGLKMDMTLATNGDCSGTAKVKRGRARFVSASDRFYLLADKGFWTAAAGAEQADFLVDALDGKWLKIPAEKDDFLAAACRPNTWFYTLWIDVAEEKGELAEINDIETIELTNETGGITTHTWVAVEEPHFIVKVLREGGDNPIDLTFSDFDKPLKTKAPPADQVFEAPR